MSEPIWCEVRQHYCRCQDYGKRCDDFELESYLGELTDGGRPDSNAASSSPSQEKT